MKERIAIVEGLRTPFCRAGGVFRNIEADDLGAYVVKELMARTAFPVDEIDEVIFGNAVQPVTAANIARVIALKAGLPKEIPAFTVQRNCASGMDAITSGANKILLGDAQVIVAGATESMSRIPLLFGEAMHRFFIQLFRAKTIGKKLKALVSFRLSMLRPVIGVKLGLTDPITGMIMGLSGETLAREFGISRRDQDLFALRSHRRVQAAQERLSQEIIPIPIPPDYHQVQSVDDGVRKDLSLEELRKLKPYFDRIAGTVTAGNSCQVTDGAAAALLMTEERARQWGIEPLGYLRDYAYAAIEGERMGLGPVLATAKLLDKTGLSIKDFELIELNEAFAAQVLACFQAFGSKNFAQKYLGRDQALGELNREIVNVNGGAIALGHPVGTTGMRLVITLLKEMKRRNNQLGLATLCVGGGQGAALALESV